MNQKRTQEQLHQRCKRLQRVLPGDVCTVCYAYLPDMNAEENHPRDAGCYHCGETCCYACTRQCTGCKRFVCLQCNDSTEHCFREPTFYCAPCTTALLPCSRCDALCPTRAQSHCACKRDLCCRCVGDCLREGCATKRVCKECCVCNECTLELQQWLVVSEGLTMKALERAIRRLLPDVLCDRTQSQVYDPLNNAALKQRNVWIGEVAKEQACRRFTYHAAKLAFKEDRVQFYTRLLRTTECKWLEFGIYDKWDSTWVIFLTNGQRAYSMSVRLYVDYMKSFSSTKELFQTLLRILGYQK